MGVIYTKLSDGVPFMELNDSYKKQVISEYYFPFHHLIDDTTLKLLDQYDECYFIDLHSFSDEFVERVFNKKDTPDICIGVDKDYTDICLLQYTIDFFEKMGIQLKLIILIVGL